MTGHRIAAAMGPIARALVLSLVAAACIFVVGCGSSGGAGLSQKLTDKDREWMRSVRSTSLPPRRKQQNVAGAVRADASFAIREHNGRRYMLPTFGRMTQGMEFRAVLDEFRDKNRAVACYDVDTGQLGPFVAEIEGEYGTFMSMEEFESVLEQKALQRRAQ